MRLGIHRSYKFIQSLELDMVKHAQSDWKQQVSHISKMWLGIQKYIYMIQSIHVDVVRQTWTCPK